MSNYYDDDNDYEDVEESCDEYSDGNENEDDDGDELEDCCGGVIDGDEIESKENDGEDEINENIESGEIENDDYNDNEDDENNDGEDNDSDEDYYNFKMNEIKSSKIIQPTLEISKQQSSSSITPITKNTKRKIKAEISSSSQAAPSSPQLHQKQQSLNYRHKLNWDAIEKRAIYNYIIPQTRIYKQMSRGVPAVASKMLVNLFKVKSFKSAYIIPEINRNECFYNRTSNNAYNKK